ncbi:MAG TPA: patatin-like phospholipase family protein [Stellaceae bacterium]|nr:patatin-like phospholipase family protein [Stellaceae bacterium]
MALALGLAACGGAEQYPNQPLPAHGANVDERGLQPTVSRDRPVILMMFSGGGSRAAALALAVLEELKRYSYTSGGQPRKLTDDIDFISSVSGGSVTAAYVGLYGTDDTARLKAFLAADNMAMLEIAAVNPITWGRLIFTGYTRIDALRDLLDRQLFDRKTFAAMNARGYPVIVLNATDMSSGEVFAFTAERFNDICSDLPSLPISVGVSASAAFPVLLSPVDLRDYAGADCVGNVPTPDWIIKELEKRAAPYLDVEEYKRARYAYSLRREHDAFRDVQYLHLLDGGLVDNLGAHSLMNVVTSPHGTVRLLNAINDGKISKLVVIAVNARSDPPNSVSTDPGTPGVIPMIGAVTSNPIDAATASVDTQLRALLGEIKTAAADAPRTASFKGMRVYDIQIDFDQLLPSQKELQTAVKSTPTLWSIKPEQLQAVNQAGTLLLDQHPCFQKLLIDLGIPAGFIDRPFAEAACPQQ